jgi:hypothetical protein
MKLSRSSRFVTAFIALCSMLFIQYAVASYACPSFGKGQLNHSITMTAEASNSDMQGMSGCTGMDANQPSLCHAYGQEGKQSLDKPGVPHVQPFTAAVLTVVFDILDVAYKPIVSLPDSHLLARATAPPLSIRNCCFRI